MSDKIIGGKGKSPTLWVALDVPTAQNLVVALANALQAGSDGKKKKKKTKKNKKGKKGAKGT
jgi:hypothetical protein